MFSGIGAMASEFASRRVRQQIMQSNIDREFRLKLDKYLKTLTARMIVVSKK